MNKILKIVSMGLFLLLFSCDEDRAINVLKIGEITEIKLDETVDNPQYGLSLQVKNINDSRCPNGVMCFWEGNASVEFNLTTKSEKYNFTLDTHYHPMFVNDTVIEGVKYQLINVLPYPDINKEQVIKVVEILVEK